MANHTEPIMQNGWFCPNCQELIEHTKTYINKRLYFECSRCHSTFKAPTSVAIKDKNRHNGHTYGVKNQQYLDRTLRPCLRCGKPYLVGPNGFHRVCVQIFTLIQALEKKE